MTSAPTSCASAARAAASDSGGAPSIVLTLWTDDPAVARQADLAGIDRIGPDLERLGKRERQGAPGFWLSPHREDSLPRVRESIGRARLFARTNPPHDDWAAEADRLIGAGVEVLMLPAFRSTRQVREAARVIGGRAELVPLIETAEALDGVREIAACPEVSEVHFGLNDLGLSFGLRNRFAVLLQPQVERATNVLAEHGVRVGIGGVGRAGDTALPIPSDLIYAQYPRLGATGALISRSFFRGLRRGPDALAEAVADARERFVHWYRSGEAELQAARTELEHRLAQELARP